jgi:hypothetical protein
MAETDFRSVDEYIASQPEAVQDILGRVRSAIRKAVPQALEVISYKIPTYKLHNRTVLLFRWMEAALLALPGHGARRRRVQGRACIIRGQQGHNPLPTLPARPREVDRTYREVPREGSGRAGEGEGGQAEGALGQHYGATWLAEPIVLRFARNRRAGADDKW